MQEARSTYHPMSKLTARRVRCARCVGVKHRNRVAGFSFILHEPVRSDVLVARRCCGSDPRRLHGLGKRDSVCTEGNGSGGEDNCE
jgi:hypothetical protein